MPKPAKPYPPLRVFLIGLAIATVFSLTSLFFLSLQAKNSLDRAVGEIIAIEGQTLTITDGRHRPLTMYLADDLKLRGRNDVSELTVGLHIMSGGHFQPDGTFLATGLRVVRK